MEVLVPLVIAVFVALAIYGAIQAQKRRKELQAWAAAKGLSYHASRDHRYEDRYPDFQVLRKGSNRYAYDIMSGSWNGRQVVCFDYHYETTSTDSKGRRKTNHHRFSAVILHHGLPFEPLFIRPEGFFDKVTEFFGLDDIDFELDAFSRAFYVKCSDKRFAFDVIHQATMEYMLGAPRFTLDFEGPSVCIYKNGTFRLAQFEAAIGLAQGILDRLPDYLLQDMKGGRG